MSKFLNNIFGNKSATVATSNNVTTKSKKSSSSEGTLETDALPVDDGDVTNTNGYAAQMSAISSSTPSASAELTADVVRELSDPNYNSMREVVSVEERRNEGEIATLPNVGNNAITTSNTMNVHNAQQQLVMQFSNVNQLHFGSVYNFNNNLSANSSRKSSGVDEMSAAAAVNGGASSVSGETKRQTPRKTTSVVAMMQSQDEPDHRMLDTIATHLGEGWKLVMRNLGHSEGQIEQAIIDHQMHGGIKEVIYQLLLQWLRNAEDGEATISRITTLLWEMQHRECVQRMKLVFKSNAMRKTR